MDIKSILLAASISFWTPATYAQEVSSSLVKNAEYVWTVLWFYDTAIDDTTSETTKYYLWGLPPAAIQECNDYEEILSCWNIDATQLPHSTEILDPNFSPSPNVTIWFQTWQNKDEI